MLLSPFPYFGGKRSITAEVWDWFGAPTQYIEPFCGSAAMLLAAPKPAALEVINDGSGFIANFWRATKHQFDTVAQWADYPVSHIDLGARHGGRLTYSGGKTTDKECVWYSPACSARAPDLFILAPAKQEAFEL